MFLLILLLMLCSCGIETSDSYVETETPPVLTDLSGFYRGELKLLEDTCEQSAPEKIQIRYDVRLDGNTVGLMTADAMYLHGETNPDRTGFLVWREHDPEDFLYTYAIDARGVTDQEASIIYYENVLRLSDQLSCTLFYTGLVKHSQHNTRD